MCDFKSGDDTPRRAEDMESLRQWVGDGCPEGVSGMPELVQWLLEAKDREVIFNNALVCKVANLEKAVSAMQSFAQQLIRDWTENDGDEDDYSDGYEDCLSDYARRARAALREAEVALDGKAATAKRMANIAREGLS